MALALMNKHVNTKSHANFKGSLTPPKLEGHLPYFWPALSHSLVSKVALAITMWVIEMALTTILGGARVIKISKDKGLRVLGDACCNNPNFGL